MRKPHLYLGVFMAGLLLFPGCQKHQSTPDTADAEPATVVVQTPSASEAPVPSTQAEKTSIQTAPEILAPVAKPEKPRQVLDADGLPVSWVNPAPEEIQKHEFRPSPLAPLVSLGKDGSLSYQPYSPMGDKIPDFSTVGYKYSETPIPSIPVIETLTPPSGAASAIGNMRYPVGKDSHAQIQEALDRVAARPPGADGFRGTVLLKKGMWYVGRNLHVRSGVVLRGEGDGEDGTVLIFTIPEGNGTGIQIGHSASAGTTSTSATFVTGVLGKDVLDNGNTGYFLTLDNGEEFRSRTMRGDQAGSLEKNLGNRVTLEYVAITRILGNEKTMTLKHTKPQSIKVLAQGEKGPPIDPELILPHMEASSTFVGAESPISEEYIPTGSFRVTVADAEGFNVGDSILVKKTTNDAWIETLGMGQRLRHIRGGSQGASKRPWGPQQYSHNRKITAIEGNTLILDSPMIQSIAAVHGGGLVTKVKKPVDDLSGVESLRIVSNYDTTVEDKSKSSNFKNLRNGINLSAVDSWVRNVTVKHVWFAAVAASRAQNSTIRDCVSLEPVGPKRGGRRYTFNIAHSSGILVYNCYAEDGRHDFVVGARTPGPNAFVDCTAVRGGQSEPHHRWGAGILYDNVSMVDGGSLAAINRGDSGSGHGWAGANTIFWNCNAENIVIADPETIGENNFAIGFTGTLKDEYSTGGLSYANTRAGYWGTPKEGKYFGFAIMGDGYIESPDAPVEPASLFKQQLIDRIGKARAMQVLQ
jgi:hypothetical protein